MKFAISTLLLTSLLLNSCKKNDNDTEKPKIISFVASSSVNVGGNILLSSDISDNNLLKSYKIVVENIFGYTEEITDETARFSYIYVGEIENQNIYTINNLQINIPTNSSAGPYTLKLVVIDNKGNESTEKIHYFEIINSTDQPTCLITEPTNSSSYNQGDTIYVAGTLQDDKAIKEINLTASNTNGSFYTNQFIFDTIITTNFNLASDGNIKIPIPTLNGNYSLQVNIKDTTGNLKQSTINFNVN